MVENFLFDFSFCLVFFFFTDDEMLYLLRFFFKAILVLMWHSWSVTEQTFEYNKGMYLIHGWTGFQLFIFWLVKHQFIFIFKVNLSFNLL